MVTGSTGSPGRWIPGSLGRWVAKCDPVPSLTCIIRRHTFAAAAARVRCTHAQFMGVRTQGPMGSADP